MPRPTCAQPCALLTLLLAAVAIGALPLAAQPIGPLLAPAEETATPAEPQPPGFWDRANLFGDMGGVRSRLANRGVTFGLTEASEVFGNPTGGVRRGVVYEGLTQFGVGIDTEKAFGLAGGTFNVTGYQIHGRGLSLNNLANNLHTVSSIEALRGTLLFELWYEQALFDKKLSIRVGQMAADQEFMISQNGTLFLNHTFGWSTFPSVNLPSGGPAYPLATPGVRVRYTPQENIAVLAAVYNGDPAGPGPGFPQNRNPSGTAFRLRDGVFAIAELQYGINQGEGAQGLPGTYKVGAWYNSQTFPDQRRDAGGVSLADPALTNALGRSRRGNASVYVVADQLVWRKEGAKDGGIGVFARAMGAPGDRNLLNVYLEGGVTYKGPFEGRDNDTVGLGVGYARFSDTANKLDSDAAAFNGTPAAVRRHETVLELTYQAQVTGWLQVQPTAQYVFNINGGIANPQQPGKRVNDALVLGLRGLLTF